MNKPTILAALAAATTLASPAMAGDAGGKAQVEVLTTRHKLDPWVVSGGVTYRF